ncbi:MAG: aminotransferase class V-fold PLP-dependent enzyme [Microbacteriaceae bacterium]
MPASPTPAQLDERDPLSWAASRFVDPGPDVLRVYLDGNSLGRPLRVSADRLGAFVRNQWGGRLIRGWDEQWMTAPTTLGDRLGQVVLGAAPGQTIVADSTSVLLYKLARAAIDARPGREEIVVGRDDFPTDRFILEGIACETGRRIRWVDTAPDAGITPELLSEAVGEKTALVVVSHVAYRSGFLADAAALTRIAHDAGALLLLDTCHSAGAVAVELDAWGVDLAAGCTYKYLNGGPGSPAYAYVAERHHGELRQPIQGWMGAADPFAMTSPYSRADGIRAFLSGTPPILAMQPLSDMVELIAEVGIEAIRAKSLALGDLALDLVDRRLAPLGVTVSSPRDPDRRGSHVTIDHAAFRDMTASLWADGIIPDFRPPSGLRLGMSPLSTGFRELERGVEEIRHRLRAAA